MSIVHEDKIWVEIAKNFEMRTSGGGGVISDFGHPRTRGGGGVKKGKIFADVLYGWPLKSYGPDDVHPKLLKSLADDSSFVNAVVELFRKCTDSGTLPQVWKSANLSSLFKSGSKTDPLNYRPVSLTCILCKL